MFFKSGSSMSEAGNSPIEPGIGQGAGQGAGQQHLSPQQQRDLEIHQLQKHARFSVPGIEAPPHLAPAPPRKALMLLGGFLALLLVAGGLTLTSQVMHAHSLARRTELNAVPTVVVTTPAMESPDEDLVLPGSLQAFEEAPIYARTNGYLLRWYKDIGSKVKQGELLADLDTPEVDQELNQARAAREQSRAAEELAKLSAERWEKLLKSHSVSAQESDQQTSGYRQAQANLAAADANVRRQEQTQGFKKVYAPFTGVLTKRNVDPGALINAGSSTPGRELFDLARVDPLRVFTNVPQTYAPYIKVGARAVITLQEFPGQRFLGSVTRTAEAIDPATRTLVTEVDLPNPGGKLLPGSFGQVHFTAGAGVNKVTIPVNTLLFRAEGPRVAVVAGGKVTLRPISIGRDYGTSLEILGGLSAWDSIVVNPSDSLEEGQPVRTESLRPDAARK